MSEETIKKIKDIREMTGLSRSAFSEKYGIPINTVRDWEQEVRRCPDYVNQLLERCAISDAEDAISPEEMTERQQQFYKRGQSNLSNFNYEKGGKRHIKSGNVIPTLIGKFKNGIEVIGFLDKAGRCVSIAYFERGSFNKMILECEEKLFEEQKNKSE